MQRSQVNIPTADDGQNWGFPTYNWEEMAKDNYAWWRARLGQMAYYFHAYHSFVFISKYKVSLFHLIIVLFDYWQDSVLITSLDSSVSGRFQAMQSLVCWVTSTLPFPSGRVSWPAEVSGTWRDYTVIIILFLSSISCLYPIQCPTSDGTSWLPSLATKRPMLLPHIYASTMSTTTYSSLSGTARKRSGYDISWCFTLPSFPANI